MNPVMAGLLILATVAINYNNTVSTFGFGDNFKNVCASLRVHVGLPVDCGNTHPRNAKGQEGNKTAVFKGRHRKGHEGRHCGSSSNGVKSLNKVASEESGSLCGPEIKPGDSASGSAEGDLRAAEDPERQSVCGTSPGAIAALIYHLSKTQTIIYEAHWNHSCNRRTAGTLSFSFGISAYIKHQTAQLTDVTVQFFFFFFKCGICRNSSFMATWDFLKRRLENFS